MLLTVFTPTYNRAETIGRLYLSLKSQNFLDFEWLIVDDGSTDDTSDLIKSYRTDAAFPVRYICKENGGKHTAYNIGLQEARGELFFNVDSDDMLSVDSLEQISHLSDIIFSHPECGGIIALKSYCDGKIIGVPFRESGIFRTFRELELEGQGGERSLVFRTSIARKYPFPVLEGERFMTEAVVYDRFVDYRFLVINQSLTACEYQPDGLSSNPKRLMLRNPGGYTLYYRNRIDTAVSFRERLGYILRYNYFFRTYKGHQVTPYRGSSRHMATLLKLLTPLVARFYRSGAE